MYTKVFRITLMAAILVMIAVACGPQPTPTTAPSTEAPAKTEAPAATEVPTEVPTQAPQEFTFGMLLVGPYNDRGWSQAHYDAGLYVEQHLPGTKMVYIDKVNSADRPGTTPAQLAEELVAQGAKLVIFNSDDMKDGAIEFAQAHPEILVIHASGDTAWSEGKNYLGLPNLANVMPQMEYTKMIAGCAAALTTQTGKIGYIGPLINDETRRFVDSAYLGAKYCWTNYLGKNAADLEFKVTWIGFWFNIPGFTSDPTQVANEFINSGYDVLMSGLDTTEAVTEAGKAQAAGKIVWAVGYDYPASCDEAPDSCLGVPFFNWGPAYVQMIGSAVNGAFEPSWDWLPPDWNDINNLDTTGAGFIKGNALTPEASAYVDRLIQELGSGLILWKGPLNLQDGTAYLTDGEVATTLQIWYMPQLLEGMEGQSVSQ
jgi:simple sugar transport system substrate-binding protein